MINDREEVAFTVGDEVGGLTYYREGVYIHSPTDGVIHQIAATGVGIPEGGFTYNRPSLQGFNHQGRSFSNRTFTTRQASMRDRRFVGSVVGASRRLPRQATLYLTAL